MALEKQIKEMGKTVRMARSHYALEAKLTGETFASLGVLLGVTGPRAREIYTIALRHLKRFDTK